MNRETFDDLLHRRGADLARWPRDEAEAARRLMAADPFAALMFAEFGRFESELKDAVHPPPFGAAEMGHVLAALDAEPEGWRPSRRFWIAGVSLSALSFAAGVMLAILVFSAQGNLDISSPIAELGLGEGGIGGLL